MFSLDAPVSSTGQAYQVQHDGIKIKAKETRAPWPEFTSWSLGTSIFDRKDF